MTAPEAQPELTPERHAGQLYRHKTGWLYREVVRNTAAEHYPEKAKMTFWGPDGIGPCTATDAIEKGEEFVVYVSETGAGTWARPARLFDDGRFVPVPTAPDLTAEQVRALLEKERSSIARGNHNLGFLRDALTIGDWGLAEHAARLTAEAALTLALARAEAAEKENRRLREALGWYASSMQWIDLHEQRFGPVYSSRATKDLGKIARAALAPAEAEQQGNEEG